MLWSYDKELRSGRVDELVVSQTSVAAEDDSARLSVRVRAVVTYWPFGQGGAGGPARPHGTVGAALSVRSAAASEISGYADREVGAHALAWGRSWVRPPPPLRQIPTDRELLLEMPVSASFELTLPPLWPGLYHLRCVVAELLHPGPRIGKTLSPAAAVTLKVEGELKTITADDPPPIYATSLAALVPGPGPGECGIGEVRVAFTTEHTGFPVLELRSLADRGADAPGGAALAEALEIDRALHRLPDADLTRTIFMPVSFRHGPLAGARANSERLALAARGTMSSAIKTNSEELQMEGMEQAAATAMEAIRFDPHNLNAYEAAAQATAMAGNRALAIGLFLTLLFRMRAAERVLAAGQYSKAGSWWASTMTAYRHRLPWDFWPGFEQLSEILGLRGSGLDLEFPQLAKIGKAE